MGRKVHKLVLGPAGVCDACGRYCWTLIGAGSLCCFCHAGIFMHRSFWTYAACAFCGDSPAPDCPVCHGEGIMAAPREDLDMAALDAAHRAAEIRSPPPAAPPCTP